VQKNDLHKKNLEVLQKLQEKKALE